MHSPFTFHTLNYVIFEQTPYYNFLTIENLRQQLQHNNTPLKLQPLGTSKTKTTTVARELKNSAKSPRLAQLLQRLCASNQSHYIIELGTNLGLSTAYLASNNSNSQVYPRRTTRTLPNSQTKLQTTTPQQHTNNRRQHQQYPTTSNPTNSTNRPPIHRCQPPIPSHTRLLQPR